MTDIVTLTTEYNALVGDIPAIADRLDGAISLTSSAKDGMMKGNRKHYLARGYEGLGFVDAALKSSNAPKPARILDYASGYGRVARWLKAGYPDAHLACADIDQNALISITDHIGAETFLLDKAFSDQQYSSGYDVIWCGSIFTHISEANAKVLLSNLVKALNGGGVLVLTTHGEFVQSRIETGEKLYSLKQDQRERVVSQWADGVPYIFESYPHMTDYGISMVREAHFGDLARSAGLKQIFYEARGWGRHQDVFAFSKSAG